MIRLKKMLTVGVLSMTVLSMTMVVSPVSAATTLVSGDLVMKSPSKAGDAVYAYVNGAISPFPNEETYKTYYMLASGKADWSGIKKITQAEFDTLSFGKNVVYRPGTALVSFSDNPGVRYAVEPGAVIRKVSDTVAASLYGANWSSMVYTETGYLRDNYTIGSDMTADDYPAGAVLSKGSSLYYYDGTNYRQFANEGALVANDFNTKFVVTTTKDITAGGTAISGVESALAGIAVKTTSSTGPATGTGSGLTVALAADTPAAATYIRDNSNAAPYQAQLVAPFTKLNFTASADGDVVVTTVKLTRGGISADTDLSNVYLYDGTTKLAEYTSFSSKVITFTNTAGLFTVTKGTTKTITVKADIANNLTVYASTVSGIVLGVNAAADIVAGTATVSGSFPMNGNSMAVGTVSDLGYLNIATVNTTNFPATIDPGVTGQELFRFNVTANDQQMNIESIKLTVVGTVSSSDITNLMLKDTTGTQIGSTITAMPTSKELVFDATASPYAITSGQTKTLIVYGDVPLGSGRAFRFTIRKVSDVVAKDNGYGIYTAPSYNSAAFTIVDPDASGDGTNMNNGTITAGLATDTPVNSVAAGATGVTIAKYTLKANGEDVKVNTLYIGTDHGGGSEAFKNGKLLWNGSQVGSTDSQVDDDDTPTAGGVSYTVNQVIPAGQTVVVSYVIDTIDYAAATTDLSSDTVVADLVASTTDATGQSSLANVAITGVTGKTLTLNAGTLVATKNLAFADMATATPTGVKGSIGAKVASFIITAGTGEGSAITQIVVRDNAAGVDENFGNNFQNLKLMTGSTQLGASIGTLAHAGSDTYTFNVSPAYSLGAGQQMVVDVYADILSNATGYITSGNATGLEFASVTGTGLLTSAATTDTDTAGVTPLQKIYISANGNLTITANPITDFQAVMGSTDNTIGSFNFIANASSEDLSVSVIKITADARSASFSNVKFYDDTTLLGTVSSFNSSHIATLNLATAWTIAKGKTKILTVKADVNSSANATSASATAFSIANSDSITTIGIGSGQAITETVGTVSGASVTPVNAKLTISVSPNSPSGATTGQAGQTVAIYNFANSSVAGQTITVKDIALTMSTSGSWTQWANGSSKSITVRRDSASGTLLGTSILQGSPISIAAGAWASGAGQTSGSSTLTDFDVPAGGSGVNLYVIADTSNAPATTGKVSTSLAAGSVTWSDGTTAGAAITSCNSLPLNSGTLSY